MATRVKRNGNFISVEEQLSQFQKSIKDLIKDPKDQRKVYLSLMRKTSLPIVKNMRTHVKLPEQTRLRGSIAARNVPQTFLRKRGATYEQSLEPVIHIGPKRSRRKVKGADGAIKEDMKFAKYWAIIAYGTKDRKTKAGHRTGTIQPNNYADKAFNSITPQLAQMNDKILKRMMQTYETILRKRGLTR